MTTTKSVLNWDQLIHEKLIRSGCFGGLCLISHQKEVVYVYGELANLSKYWVFSDFNMSELDDIAAAAGIVIIDTPPGDGGDADNKNAGLDGGDSNRVNLQQIVTCGRAGDTVISPQETALEAMFSQRYTMDDSDYAQTVSDTEFTSRPPCVKDYRGRRQREDNRHRGGRGYGRGHHYGNRHYQDRGDSRSWHHRDGGDGRDQYRDRSRDGGRRY